MAPGDPGVFCGDAQLPAIKAFGLNNGVAGLVILYKQTTGSRMQ